MHVSPSNQNLLAGNVQKEQTLQLVLDMLKFFHEGFPTLAFVTTQNSVGMI